MDEEEEGSGGRDVPFSRGRPQTIDRTEAAEFDVACLSNDKGVHNVKKCHFLVIYIFLNHDFNLHHVLETFHKHNFQFSCTICIFIIENEATL